MGQHSLSLYHQHCTLLNYQYRNTHISISCSSFAILYILNNDLSCIFSFLSPSLSYAPLYLTQLVNYYFLSLHVYIDFMSCHVTNVISSQYCFVGCCCPKCLTNLCFLINKLFSHSFPISHT